MSIFTGSAVALITPFHNGQIDYKALETIIELQIAAGSDAIVALGTTGEASTLSAEEREEATRFFVEHVSGRIPVIVGTGGNNTEEVIERSRFAEAVGADGLLIVTPYYNKTTQDGLVAHYCAISEQVRTPIIAYNVPSRTGLNLQPQTMRKILDNCENVVGIKEASGNISQIVKIMTLTDGNIDLYSGNDDQVVPLMSMGGLGVISVVSNIAPRAVHDMCEKMLAGDVKGAAQIQKDTLDLCENLFSEVNPIPVKKAVNLMGFNAGPLRMPLTEMEDAHAKKLEEAMRNFGILK
jgi:4-hydroxy-tetrahydrodipicolinate synthase